MKTNNLPLIVGIALPFIFILIVLAAAYIPSLSVDPQHDFMYTQQEYSYSSQTRYKNTYKVEGGRIATEPLKNLIEGFEYSEFPDIYLYDVENDTSRKISFEEAKDYALQAGPSSPDGYVVSYEYGHNGIFEIFGSNDSDRGYFISKDNKKKRLHNLSREITYYGDFKVIGWVK